MVMKRSLPKFEMAPLGLSKQLTRSNCSLLNDIKVFLFDCDGVLWKGTQSIDKAAETINYLTASGKLVYFVVHN